MKARTAIELLAKLKVIGIKIEKDGSLKKRFSSYAWLWMVHLGVYVANGYAIYYEIQGSQQLNFNHVVFICLINALGLVSLFDMVAATEMISGIENLDDLGDAQLGWPKFLLDLLTSALISGGVLLGKLEVMERENQGHTICLVLVTIFYNMMMVLFSIVGYAVLSGFQSTERRSLLQKSLTRDNLALLTKKYNKIQSAFGFVTFTYYVGIQISLICAIYMILIARHVPAVLLITAGIFSFLTSFLVEADLIYQMKAKLVTKGRADALENTHITFTELLHHRDACTQLENTGPINGLGFVDFDRSIIPSLLGTTLTYIIVLVQSQSLLNSI